MYLKNGVLFVATAASAGASRMQSYIVTSTLAEVWMFLQNYADTRTELQCASFLPSIWCLNFWYGG